jgi:amino acid adenylation domain-containing protein/non-ribosomal peptide synthase protein (TIGR01720 family)
MRPENIESIYELSPTQQGLLFHSLYSPQSGMYAGQFTFTFTDLDVAAFEQAWQRVMERHETFRTSFYWEETDKPLQVVARRVHLPFAHEDWRGSAPEEQESRLRQFLDRDRARDFDLARAPLMRLMLIRLGETAYEFIWTHHHLLLDGWSVGLVLKEVFSLYSARRSGAEPVPAQPRPFRDYVLWLRRQDAGRAERYWRARLSGLTRPTPLPGASASASPGASSVRYEERRVSLGAELSGALRAAARQHHLTLSTVTAGAWALLLARYGGVKDVLYGAVVSGRPAELAGAEEMVGLFINTLPVRVTVDEEAGIWEWLRRLQDEQAEMREYEYSPLVEVQRWSDVPPSTPLFETIVAFENYPVDSSLRKEAQALQVSMARSTEKANYPLAVVLIPKSEIIIKLSYDDSRYDGEAVGRLLEHYETLLRELAEEPGREVRSLSLLGAQERQRLLKEWSGARTDYPSHLCIHQLFEEQARQTPDSVAVVFGDEALTYAQLNARANQLAHHLRDAGVGPEVRVGVCLERSNEMIPALLAVLKAGGTYLPLDPSAPRGWLLGLLADAGSPLVLTHTRHLESLSGFSGRVVALEGLREELGGRSRDDLPNMTTADNLAYVMYTSGSTGRPKGVSAIHRAVVRLVKKTNYADFNPAETFLQLAPLAFDASTFEIWGSLLNGALLVVMPPEPPSLEELGRALRQHEVTTLWLTAGLFHVMVDEQLEALKGVRHILAGGEALSVPHVERLLDEARETRLTNGYGPTENTTFSTCYTMSGPQRFAGPVPIGRPISNTEVYILGTDLQPVPCGVQGELYLGGDGLARGYLHRPALTAERFIPHPFAACPGARLYQTGDVVRFLPSGDVEFIGRRDDQVKIRGFRIEPGEAEAVLRQHPAVREAAVVAREGTAGQRQLVAYVVGAQPTQGSAPGSAPDEWKQYLRERLPDYLVPAAFVTLDALPLTPNGKIDRRALPAPDLMPAGGAGQYVAPRTEAERVLCEVWTQVLGREQVGIHDNFFDLGGDSILSIQVVARANRAGLRLTPRQVFEHSTVSKLAAVVGAGGVPAAGEEVGEKGAAGPREEAAGEVTLTPIQHWFFSLGLRRPHHFNQSSLLRLRTGSDPALLRRALQHLIDYHDALRLRFSPDGQDWLSHYAPGEEVSFRLVDLGRINDAAERRRVIEAEATATQASLDITEGPLLRAVYFHCGEEERARLLLVIHHLAVDGVSWRILLDDLQRAYARLAAGESIELGPKTTSFQRWSRELIKQTQTPERQAELAYWEGQPWERARLLPLDSPGEQLRLSSARALRLSLSAAETEALLREVPEAYHTQINEVLLAALGRALGAWAGAGEVVVDLEGHGREEMGEGVDVSRTVGWFTAIFPVLLRMDGSEEVGAALRRVKEQLRAIPRRGVGFGMLKYLSENDELRHRMRQIPGAQLNFNYLGQFDQVADSDAVISGAAESCGPAQSLKNPLPTLITVNSTVHGRRLEMVWTYSEVVHRRETLEWLAERYMDELREIIAHCRTPEAGGFTPSDFPLAGLSEEQFGRISALISELSDD